MPTIFISHSDSDAAIALERALRSAFPGAVTVFNTSRTASGLAAGAAIDTEVIDRLANAELIIWLASPQSVQKSFWMAWELGAATAFKKVVIPARCFGLRPDDLPLLQGNRMAPDLGERDGMQSLLTTVRDHLHLDEERIAETLDALHKEGRPSPLWGIESPKTITLKLLGRRMLIENHCSEDIHFRRLRVLADTTNDEIDLMRQLSRLPAAGRHILDAQHSVDLAQRMVEVEWTTASGARHFAREYVDGGMN